MRDSLIDGCINKLLHLLLRFGSADVALTLLLAHLCRGLLLSCVSWTAAAALECTRCAHRLVFFFIAARC